MIAMLVGAGITITATAAVGTVAVATNANANTLRIVAVLSAAVLVVDSNSYVRVRVRVRLLQARVATSVCVPTLERREGIPQPIDRYGGLFGPAAFATVSPVERRGQPTRQPTGQPTGQRRSATCCNAHANAIANTTAHEASQYLTVLICHASAQTRCTCQISDCVRRRPETICV